MSTQLIADAAQSSRARDDATVWDRIFAFWSRRLVYTQIWEDPEADLAAMQLPLGSTIVTISSGGCNALSYLTAQPAQVYAVDLNEAHLSLLKLKLAGIFLEKPHRSRMRVSIASGCGRCSTGRRVPIGISAMPSDVHAMPISRTDFIATASWGDLSASPMSWRDWPGSIVSHC
jgi:S-adenosylmethionine:diacylglycerol 3-amino-3-carboxypropyl transferase